MKITIQAVFHDVDGSSRAAPVAGFNIRSFGARRCNLNISEPDLNVFAARVLSAGLMDNLDWQRQRFREHAKDDAADLLDTAIEHLQAAQMFAVKALIEGRDGY